MDAAPPPPPHHHQAARPTGAVWSLVPWVRALRDHRAAAHAHEEKRRIIPRRTQLYTADYRQRQPSRGDVKLRTLRSALAWFDSIGFARSKHQRLFHARLQAALGMCIILECSRSRIALCSYARSPCCRRACGTCTPVFA
jgi:hypothetical protein